MVEAVLCASALVKLVYNSWLRMKKSDCMTVLAPRGLEIRH